MGDEKISGIERRRKFLADRPSGNILRHHPRRIEIDTHPASQCSKCGRETRDRFLLAHFLFRGYRTQHRGAAGAHITGIFRAVDIPVRSRPERVKIIFQRRERRGTGGNDYTRLEMISLQIAYKITCIYKVNVYIVNQVNFLSIILFLIFHFFFNLRR